MYKEISSRLLSMDGGGSVKHVDLWNHNVEFIEQEDAWARPAVFVEFGTIEWREFKDKEWRGRFTVRLHIVTDWCGATSIGSATDDASLSVFDLSTKIQCALDGMRGASYGPLTLLRTSTNHNHEEIVENIDEYDCFGVRTIEG